MTPAPTMKLWHAAALVGAFFLCSLAGQQMKADAGKFVDTYKENAERHRIQVAARDKVRTLLRDPSSARFDNEVITAAGSVCGWINARNAFGGYAGRSPYVVTASTVHFDDVAAYMRHCN
jgi:hypothetical protein